VLLESRLRWVAGGESIAAQEENRMRAIMVRVAMVAMCCALAADIPHLFARAWGMAPAMRET
jgi:hypothetical protein